MRKRILIAEDDEVFADQLAAMVREKLDCVPIVATTAADALARSGTVDFGFLDIKLGDAVVFPLADRLRALSIPFVFMSATDPASVPPALSAAPFLRKPVPAPRLMAAAREHL